MAAPKIDRLWFQGKLSDQGLSQRQYAKRVGMEPAAISRTFAGERTMQIDEAVAFATIAKVPLEEVIAHAGLELPDTTSGMCHIVGTANHHGELAIRQVEAPRRAPCPPEAPESLVAVRCKTPGTAAEAMDGWLLYYVDGIKRIPADAVGRLVIAWAAGRALVGILRRGYARGTYTLGAWLPGSTGLENIAIERASPVLWVRTST